MKTTSWLFCMAARLLKGGRSRVIQRAVNLYGNKSRGLVFKLHLHPENTALQEILQYLGEEQGAWESQWSLAHLPLLLGSAVPLF